MLFTVTRMFRRLLLARQGRCRGASMKIERLLLAREVERSEPR